ncbi:hypothetical protein ABZV52_30165 [Streptomyces sp. NPDC004735]|uniref:hypothetical protein n=1 Tax=Streptomyces TaxID=1883 RepID=UPI0033B029D0
MSKKRRITGPAQSAGVHSTAPVVRMQVQAAVMQGQPVVIVLQPDTVSVVGEDGELLAADTVETSVKAAGGQPLTLTPDFTGEPAAGWQGRFTPATDELLIHFPSGVVFYDGALPSTPEWVAQVRAESSIVLLTGPMATVNDFEPLLDAGRILWTRVPLDVR